MSKKILYFDCETTGLDPVKNDIIQLAGVIEIDGRVKESFDIRMQPFSYTDISSEALEVHGCTIDEIRTYQAPEEGYSQFISILSRHIAKFDRSDKLYPAGYNVGFDLNFLAEFFRKNNDKYLGSWINWKALDPLPWFRMHDLVGTICLPNYKLETICTTYGIEIKAHDALSDIMATREILSRMFCLFKDSPFPFDEVEISYPS